MRQVQGRNFGCERQSEEWEQPRGSRAADASRGKNLMTDTTLQELRAHDVGPNRAASLVACTHRRDQRAKGLVNLME